MVNLLSHHKLEHKLAASFGYFMPAGLVHFGLVGQRFTQDTQHRFELVPVH